VIDLDVRGGGFDIAAQLRQQLEGVKLVFVAKSGSDMSIKQAIVLGAKGFVERFVDDLDLVHALVVNGTILSRISLRIEIILQPP